MEDYWNRDVKEKKINKKKIIISIVISIVVVALIVIIALYMTNAQIREWVDKNILRKEVLQDKVATIDLEEEQSANVYAFNKYIGILNKNQFSIYGNNGNEEAKLEITITNPIFNADNRFLVIGESNGQKIYLLEDKQIIWENSIEGNISQIYVNENGYVAVIISDASYKSVVSMFDPKGNEIFKTFLSSTMAIDVSISKDNKYLAIAEVDTSGTIIQSNIRIMSIEKAKTDPENAIEKNYKSEQDKLITNVKYQAQNKLICMYTDKITIIENEQENTLVDNKDKKIISQSIELENNAVSIEEKSSGIFSADSVVNITNIDTKEVKQYTVDSVVKEIYTKDNVVALNLGTEIEFVSTNGWLIKRYIANQEITNVTVANNIAGIIYRDKIEIINL